MLTITVHCARCCSLIVLIIVDSEHAILLISCATNSVAAGQARPGRGYFLLGLALAGPHFFVRGWPVAWPAVGQIGRAKSGQAGYMAGLALAGLWPD